MSDDALSFDEKPALIDLIQAVALRRGQFTLASGKRASYYLDCRQATLDPRGAHLIGHAMLRVIEQSATNGMSPDAVGGMAIGADPITAAIVTIAGGQNKTLRGFMVRKEPKGHGMGRQVEGPVQPGENVVIVEDVITSGGSALQAAQAAQSFGLKVLYVLAIVDRLAGGEAAFATAGLSLKTLLTVRDFGIDPEA